MPEQVEKAADGGALVGLEVAPRIVVQAAAGLEARGAAPGMRDRPNRRHRHCFSKALYRDRNCIERFLKWIKRFRWVAICFEKHAANTLAMVELAAIRLWLRERTIGSAGRRVGLWP